MVAVMLKCPENKKIVVAPMLTPLKRKVQLHVAEKQTEVGGKTMPQRFMIILQRG